MDGVCQGLDYADLVDGDAEDAVDFAVSQTETVAAYRQQALGLAEELRNAENSTEATTILGKAALCQTASSLSD